MNKVKIFGKDSKSRINNLKDWKTYAPPANPIHWKEGRSAMELAKSWIDGNNPIGPISLESLLRKQFRTDDIILLKAYAEYESKFYDTSNGPRNHDLLLEAKIDDNLYIIGIEAKEREAFDDTLDNKIISAKSNSVNTKLPRRIDDFCRVIFNKSYGDEFKNIRYQFLSGIAGTLIEAYKRNSSSAIFIVQQFKSLDTPPNDLKRNVSDLEYFLSFITKRRIDCDKDFLTGPFKVSDSAFLPPIDLYIGKFNLHL